MKLLFVIVAAFALNSCNTMIGLGRDTKQGYLWTKSKIQGIGDHNDNQPDTSGAPVY